MNDRIVAEKIKSIIFKINKRREGIADTLKKLGVRLYDINGNIRNLEDVLKDTQSAYKELKNDL